MYDYQWNAALRLQTYYRDRQYQCRGVLNWEDVALAAAQDAGGVGHNPLPARLCAQEAQQSARAKVKFFFCFWLRVEGLGTRFEGRGSRVEGRGSRV
eukprot:2949238-Rhodomonas_salina.3